ncbi:MAG TPA: hypothetical protein VFV66_00130 [Nonomuraea sp.]|nr:hypothetical protein [Nonomuraea sp.]
MEAVVAVIAAVIAAGSLAYQAGERRARLEAEQRSTIERRRRLIAEFTAAIAELEGMLQGHRQAWESGWARWNAGLHAALVFLGESTFRRRMAAVAPYTFAFSTGGARAAAHIAPALGRVTVAWAQLRQDEDQELAAAADLLYEAVQAAAIRPSADTRERMQTAAKNVGEVHRRADLALTRPRRRHGRR